MTGPQSSDQCPPPLYAEVMNASALICTSCLEEEAPIGFLIRWTPDPFGGDWLSRAGLDAIPWSAPSHSKLLRDCGTQMARWNLYTVR